MKTIRFFTTAMMAIGLIFFIDLLYTGCKKDTASPTASPSNTGVAAASDNSIASSSFDDVTNTVNEAMMVSQSGSARISDEDRPQTSCARISANLTDAINHTLLINYGTTDCLGKDGNYRRGEIIVTWTGPFYGPGASHTITFNNFFVNFNQIMGNIVVLEKGVNTSGMLTFAITVKGSVIVSPLYSANNTSSTIVFNADLVKEMITGAETSLSDRDDVFLIWGTASGITQAGIPFKATITADNALRKEIGFMNFTKGIINITMALPDGQTIVSIDFSYLNSQRDNLAMVNINGHKLLVQLNTGSFELLSEHI